MARNLTRADPVTLMTGTPDGTVQFVQGGGTDDEITSDAVTNSVAVRGCAGITNGMFGCHRLMITSPLLSS
jgi:hypothetical protein